jgi:glycosyltransferase involved in cell wall biosynthesis
MPKVSVVIPTHNRPARLSTAIRSVVNQTEADFEAFVVDDGSPDDAAADVVRAFGDARLRYVRLPVSRGPGAARNAGVTRASAPYVAFLDDDDEWLPEKLAVQLAVLEGSSERVGGVYSARITVDEVAGTTVTTRCKQKQFDIYSGENVITTSAIVVRRAGFDAVGLFDETLFSGQDFDMWIRLGQAFDLMYIDQPLVRYFIHPGYRVTDDEARKARAQEVFFVKHRQVFEKNPRGHCLLYVALGMRYLRLGDKARGRRALRKALRLWPLEPRVYSALAHLFIGRKPSNSKSTAEGYARQ